MLNIETKEIASYMKLILLIVHEEGMNEAFSSDIADIKTWSSS